MKEFSGAEEYTEKVYNWIRGLIEKQGEQKPQGKTALEAINEEKVDNANKVEPRQEKLTEFERAVKQVMEEAIECGDTHNLKADADMLLSLVHNSSWSEEDDDNMMLIEDRLGDYLEYIMEDSALTKHQKNTVKEAVFEYMNWLKSLKKRYTWKPSGEQMEVLKEVKNIVGRKYKSYLNSLYSDLNKLREK
jgi:virulence-associated protein VapD